MTAPQRGSFHSLGLAALALANQLLFYAINVVLIRRRDPGLRCRVGRRGRPIRRGCPNRHRLRRAPRVTVCHRKGVWPSPPPPALALRSRGGLRRSRPPRRTARLIIHGTQFIAEIFKDLRHDLTFGVSPSRRAPR